MKNPEPLVVVVAACIDDFPIHRGRRGEQAGVVFFL